MIRVSAVVMRDRAGRVLNVRKVGTAMLMLPGGKPEAGESPLETAIREFEEELGVALDPARMRDLGVFQADAANESGFTVEAAVFEHPFVAEAAHLTPRAEIEFLEWVPLDTQRADVAPLNRDAVFPALLGRPSFKSAKLQPLSAQTPQSG